MQQKMTNKILFIIAIIVGSGWLAFAVLKEQPVGEATLSISNIQTAQDTYFAKNGKYQQILKTDSLIADKEVEVHTLHHPDGSEGYRIIETWKEGDTTYLKSIGVGKDASLFTYEKIIGVDKLATTTPK